MWSMELLNWSYLDPIPLPLSICLWIWWKNKPISDSCAVVASGSVKISDLFDKERLSVKCYPELRDSGFFSCGSGVVVCVKDSEVSTLVALWEHCFESPVMYLNIYTLRGCSVVARVVELYSLHFDLFPPFLPLLLLMLYSYCDTFRFYVSWTSCSSVLF